MEDGECEKLINKNQASKGMAPWASAMYLGKGVL
jgi:hypothetical protein